LVNINTATQNIIGDKYFEMSNHLGNVLEVVSDRKLPVNDGNGNIDYFLADVVSYSDYFPYGMQMPGKKQLRDLDGNGNPVYVPANGSDGYRYGFNGMERDDMVKGAGNSYTTEFRQYDPRVGRWLSIDPLFKNFPWQSPYVAYDNNPIVNNDPKGAAAENQSGGPGKKKDRLQEKQEDLADKRIEIPLRKENPILHKINNWRKERIKKREKRIGDKLKDLRDESMEQGGDKLNARFNTGQHKNTSGSGAGSDDNTSPLSVLRPTATELTTTDYKIGPGQVVPAPTRNTRHYNDWAEYSKANPSAIINIWGGGNTPAQSTANATQIQNDLIKAGVNPANIRIIPLSSPPPSRGSIPNGPSLW
ncbi:MAG TPA: RHS repeat-associated core domain-containing protein, partial [Brumimicrobium sp.]|nr:RHS repeat-associated core domain-containing protein [Brumimicrobium sp.]